MNITSIFGLFKSQRSFYLANTVQYEYFPLYKLVQACFSLVFREYLLKFFFRFTVANSYIGLK